MKLKFHSEKKPKEKLYGNRIRELLQKKDMSVQELSDTTGLRPSHISLIINGQRRCISLPIAFKISLALNETIENIFLYKPTAIASDNN